MNELILEFENRIFLNSMKMKSPDLENDLGGLLFSASLYSYSQDESYKKKCLQLFETFINTFENVEAGGLYKGFEGAIWVIDYLFRANIIEDKSIISELIEFNIRSIKLDISNNNFDILYGSFGKLLFFLNNSEYQDITDKLISDLLDSLEQNSVRVGNGIFWKEEGSSEKSIFNIGLAHGSPSILVFLSRLKELGYTNPKIDRLMNDIINGLFAAMKKGKNLSYFNHAYSEEESVYPHSRLGWCYGDLGITYSLVYSNKFLKSEEINQAVSKLLNSLLGRGITDSSLIHFDKYSFFDTGFCHGIAGIVYLFERIHNITGIEKVKSRIKYWENELLKNIKIQLSVRDDIYYPWWKQNKNYSSILDQNCLLTGITGTALVLLSLYYKKQNDWSEIFLIY